MLEQNHYVAGDCYRFNTVLYCHAEGRWCKTSKRRIIVVKNTIVTRIKAAIGHYARSGEQKEICYEAGRQKYPKVSYHQDYGKKFFRGCIMTRLKKDS